MLNLKTKLIRKGTFQKREVLLNVARFEVLDQLRVPLSQSQWKVKILIG